MGNISETTQTVIDRMISNLPPFYNIKGNVNSLGIITSWANSDSIIFNDVFNAKAELYVATADSYWLDLLGSNYKVNRPTSLSLDDTRYSELIPILAVRGITYYTLSSIIDIMFGPIAQRANLTCQNLEPYRIAETIPFVSNGTTGGTFETDVLTDLGIGFEIELQSDTQPRVDAVITNITGVSAPYTITVQLTVPTSTLHPNDISAYTVVQNAFINTSSTLTIYTELGLESIRFQPSNFTNHNAVTAQELADVYNTYFTHSTADVNAQPAGNYFRIRSNTVGTRSFIQVVAPPTKQVSIQPAAPSYSTANNPLNFETAFRVQNAQVYIIEKVNIPPTAIVTGGNSSPTLFRDLRGGWHIKADQTIYDPRPNPITSSAPFYPGNFLAAPAQDVMIQKLSTTLQTTIVAGNFYDTLQFGDVTQFPETTGNSIVIDFGTGIEEGPVAYSGWVNGTTLTFSPAHRFINSHSIGATVNLSTVPVYPPVVDYAPLATGYKPRANGTDYMIFLTDPLTVQEVLQELLLQALAAGVNLEILTEPIMYFWSEL